MLPPSRDWFAILHQAGGGHNEHWAMIATRLAPRRPLYPALRQLARDRWPGGTGTRDGQHFNTADMIPQEIAAYRDDLRRIGVDCASTQAYLTEALYPIDATADHLRLLSEDGRAAADLVGLCPRPAPKPSALIIVMAENSD